MSTYSLFWLTSEPLAPPGMTQETWECASGNCSAAAPTGTFCARRAPQSCTALGCTGSVAQHAFAQGQQEKGAGEGGFATHKLLADAADGVEVLIARGAFAASAGEPTSRLGRANDRPHVAALDDRELNINRLLIQEGVVSARDKKEVQVSDIGDPPSKLLALLLVRGEEVAARSESLDRAGAAQLLERGRAGLQLLEVALDLRPRSVPEVEVMDDEPAVAPSVKAGLQPCACTGAVCTRSRTHESTWSTPRRWSESWCCRMMAS